MIDPFKPLKSLLKPSPSLPGQQPIGPAMVGPMSAADAAAFQAVRSAIDRGAQFKSAEDAREKVSEIVDGAVDIADSILGDIANMKGYDAFKTGFGYVASPLAP